MGEGGRLIVGAAEEEEEELGGEKVDITRGVVVIIVIAMLQLRQGVKQFFLSVSNGKVNKKSERLQSVSHRSSTYLYFQSIYLSIFSQAFFNLPPTCLPLCNLFLYFHSISVFSRDCLSMLCFVSICLSLLMSSFRFPFVYVSLS